MTAFEKVDKIKVKLKPPLPPLLTEFDALRNKGDKGDVKSVEQAQRLLPRVLEELEDTLPNEVMEATDEATLSRMWGSPESLPSMPELEEPTLWLSRTV